jgi:hypothetical protein
MQFAATCTLLEGTPMRLIWLAPPRIAITSGDSREYRSTAFVNGAQFFYGHSAPFLRLGLNGIKKSLGR